MFLEWNINVRHQNPWDNLYIFDNLFLVGVSMPPISKSLKSLKICCSILYWCSSFHFQRKFSILTTNFSLFKKFETVKTCESSLKRLPSGPIAKFATPRLHANRLHDSMVKIEPTTFLTRLHDSTIDSTTHVSTLRLMSRLHDSCVASTTHESTPRLMSKLP